MKKLLLSLLLLLAPNLLAEDFDLIESFITSQDKEKEEVTLTFQDLKDLMKERVCEVTSEDLYDLVVMRREGASMIEVLRESRDRNEILDYKVFDFVREETESLTTKKLSRPTYSSGLADNFEEWYEASAIKMFDADDPYSEMSASWIRDESFGRCYKVLVKGRSNE